MSKTVSRQVKNKSGRHIGWIGRAAGALLVFAAAIFVLSTLNNSTSAANTQIQGEAILGDPKAPVTLIEYGAYGCTSCRAWHRAHVVEDLLKAYAGKVRFIFRDFPIIVPHYDAMAAATAHCALDQGQDRFWAFHDALYTTAVPGDSQESLLRLGQQVGLDYDKLKACTDAGTYVVTVQNNLKRAEALGLTGTPSFLVNDQVVMDSSPEALKAAIDQALHSS